MTNKNHNESISFSKQIKRYAQVGGVVGGLATKLASKKYLGLKLNKKKHAIEIKSALGNIKGPLMKVAQLSATIPDLLPPEYAHELSQLQSNAPPMGWLFVKRRMTAELGSNWQKKFKDFEKEASRAGKKAFIINRIGDLGFFIALMMIYNFPDFKSFSKYFRSY